MTEPVNPSVAEAVAQVRDQLAAGRPCVVLSTPVGAGKSAILNALLSEPALLSSGRWVKHSIAELDQLHSDLDRGDGVLVTYDPTNYASPGRPDATTVPQTSTASSADTPDLPDASVGISLPAGLSVAFDLGRRTERDESESVMFLHEEAHALRWELTPYEDFLARLQQELLCLVNRLRMVLRFRLMYILSGLSHIPDAINVVLLLLAAVRCYGRRTETSDYTPPVLTSILVVTGRLPACVS